ncbi:aconitate hydratase 2 [Campylobacter showae]|uniref:aconitate hydratase n=1 Tax=Campylobacter showae RM3277 TaxID=553219 RepID=C6RGM3_9BACT|nr:bifunctional aconitate hydratase 2/2-methylisocitrate dehydratase [Campylobacter showae]EET79573.1 aconitate hydratase 2 [Campylobacter showae RM3277]QCD48996.1 aconitate hydratase 2 [Campylobacter showae]
MDFFTEYEKHVKEREALGVPPLPLNEEQTREVCELLKLESVHEREYLGLLSRRMPPMEPGGEGEAIIAARLDENQERVKRLVNLLANRVNPGVDDAAKVKAEFLNEIINHGLEIGGLDKIAAVNLLRPMLGGYSVIVLLESLKNADEAVAQAACNVLKETIFVHDYFNDVAELAKANKFALEVLRSWAEAEWFRARASLPRRIRAVIFKVAGETNTDDLSPASEAYTRSDIPLHANAMLVKRQPGSLETINELKKSGLEIVYAGDVVGTGSSRKSGINSIQWHLGREIEGVPNKKTGGIVIGTAIAPIFFNTAEDSGALPIVADASALETGDVVDIYPYAGEILRVGRVNLNAEGKFDGVQIYGEAKFENLNENAKPQGEPVARFTLAPNTIFDEIRAGGRIPLIIGRSLCAKARAALNLGAEDIFARPAQPQTNESEGHTLAQKIVGKACGVPGVRAGQYCEPATLTVGSQDTTGPMTRDEIKELASLGFSADFVLQSFCHTAAYPKPSDLETQRTLPKFMSSRGGVSLRPGDGVIHSWLNRMVLPDTVGTGGDSHTRFPIGVSFPAGSGLVAFAAVSGAMPLNMPESVLVRFSGRLQKGVTLRDLVNAIPYYAIKRGLLTVEKKGKKNVFAGKILEIEGLENLKVEQAFELSDASAERSAAACAVNLSIESVAEYVRSNVALIEAMIEAGYESRASLERRAAKMREWLAAPELLRADKNARYAEVIEINLDEITEPILACPNDPDDVATLSEVLADSSRPHKIDEVFVGSCMTNIGHYRALGEALRGLGMLPTRLWIAPPTKMDQALLEKEGYYDIFRAVGARTEVPGCSLCMGNQARVNDGATVFSTSTRNFDNRMGMGARVYLGSAELAAVCAVLGRLPSASEYMSIVPQKLAGKEAQIYRYLNFNEIENFKI